MSGLWEFFFKYPLFTFEQGRLIFASPLPGWLLFLVAALVIAIAAITYARARGKVKPRDRIVLTVLRGLIFAVLLFAVFRPALRVSTSIDQENYVSILIDDSRSMRIEDGSDGVRADQVMSLLNAEEQGLLAELSRTYRLRLFRFSGAAERIENTEALTFTGGQSRLGQALDQVRTQMSGVPHAGIVLITDGADQAEGDLNASLLGLRAGSVPVFAVGVGREEFDKDIEVRRVATPRSVLKGSSIVVDAVVAQTGFRGETVQLNVEDEGKIVSSQPVSLPSDGTPAAVRVNFTAAEPGTRRFTFRVATQEGELIAENNQQQAVIEVQDGAKKILYVEGEPRFEVKFMRRAVENDPQLQLVVLQRTAEDKFLRLEVDSASELASGFPRTREELFSYRGLIIGSMEASYFTREQLEMIRAFVAERGGGFMMLGGRKAFSEGGYAGTAVADVLPVLLESSQDTTFFTEVLVTPTRAGFATAALQIGPDANASRERWETLPALSTFNRVNRLKPGATALLTGGGTRGGDDQIVLAHQRYGRGMALAFPVQDSWMWQMHADIPLEDQTHEIFWQQLLRWIVSDSPPPLVLTPASDRAALNQTTRIQAQLRDEGYRLVNGARMNATVEGPDGVIREIPMPWTAQRDGEYLLNFIPTVPGQHTIRVLAEYNDKSTTSTLILDASEDDGEFYGAQMRRALLERIAEETGGRFYTTGNVENLPKEIVYAGQGVTRLEQLDLWDMPIVFMLVMGLVGAEWGYRRTRGLQ